MSDKLLCGPEGREKQIQRVRSDPRRDLFLGRLWSLHHLRPLRTRDKTIKTPGLPGVTSTNPALQQMRLSEVRNCSPTPLLCASMVEKTKTFSTHGFSSQNTNSTVLQWACSNACSQSTFQDCKFCSLSQMFTQFNYFAILMIPC